MQLKDAEWLGFVRPHGRMGIRNKVLVMYTVECASFVAKEITRLSEHDEVECVGFSGCTDNEYAIRLMISLLRHPNVGGVLVVGLGCEYIQAEKLAVVGEKEGKPANWLLIQTEGGTRPTITRGLEIVQQMLRDLEEVPRAPMDITDLVVGAECGGSDYTSGLAGNAVVGHFYDHLVEAGGTAIFEEIVEAIGLIDLLEKRAVNQKAKEELRHTYNKALEYCKSVRQYSVSPGNFAGGLTTIEEKSMGAVVKSGTKPIQGVLKVAQEVPHPGLWLLDSTPDPHWMQFGITNPNDNEGLMDLISCGAHILLFVTGRGSVVGSAVSPCLKITGNAKTFSRMKDDMDFNAGLAISGEFTLEELQYSLGQMVIEIAGGAKTKSELLGHKEYCIPYKYQDSRVNLRPKCEI